MLPGYVVSAEIYASLFALMSMGLTLTYMTTKVPNFAYGDFVLIGIYSSYVAVKVFHSNPYVGSVLGFVVAGLVSVGMYLGVIRPLARRGANIVSLMIATFGFDIAMSGIFGIFTDYLQQVKHLQDAKQFYQLGPTFNLGGLAGYDFTTPLAAAAVVVAIYLLFSRTRFGVAMRAAIENPPLAKVLGINVDVVYTASWLLAGGLAGFAGGLWTLGFQSSVNTGNDLIVQIFGASVLGGLMSIFGSAAGGLIIGGSANLVTEWLNLGFGYVGTGILVVLMVLPGVYLLRRKAMRLRLFGTLLVALGIWVVVDIAVGLPIDFIAPELLNGFGAWVIAYQQAIPLLVMAATLLFIPEGIFSIDWLRLLRRRKK